MKNLPAFVIALSLVLPGYAVAAPGKSGSAPGHQTPPGKKGQTPPGQLKRPVDPDKGDDNASPAAALRLGSKLNPAALRSAIVPRPDSL